MLEQHGSAIVIQEWMPICKQTPDEASASGDLILSWAQLSPSVMARMQSFGWKNTGALS